MYCGYRLLVGLYRSNCTIEHMSQRTISFSEAREQLSTLIDEVQQSGRPVTITKRGKPAAILIDVETFETQTVERKKKWKLRGSAKWVGPMDIDGAIQEGRAKMGESLRKRVRRLAKELDQN